MYIYSLPAIFSLQCETKAILEPSAKKKTTTAKNPHNPPQHLETKRSKTPFICFYVCCRGNIAALQYPQRWAAPVINWHGLSVNPGADPPSLQSSRTSRGGQTKWRSRHPRRVIPGGGAGAVCKAAGTARQRGRAGWRRA